MFGFLTNLFSSKKAVETGCDIAKDISSGIDVMFYTDEEKAQAREKAQEKWMELMVKTRDENGPRAKTRRFLALAYTLATLTVGTTAVGMGIAGAEDAKLVADYAQHLAQTEPWILGFYFGPHIMKAIKKA